MFLHVWGHFWVMIQLLKKIWIQIQNRTIYRRSYRRWRYHHSKKRMAYRYQQTKDSPNGRIIVSDFLYGNVWQILNWLAFHCASSVIDQLQHFFNKINFKATKNDWLELDLMENYKLYHSDSDHKRGTLIFPGLTENWYADGNF